MIKELAITISNRFAIVRTFGLGTGKRMVDSLRHLPALWFEGMYRPQGDGGDCPQSGRMDSRISNRLNRFLQFSFFDIAANLARDRANSF
jgi:hypothetical protein